jgi:hypothetical protein
MATLTPNLWRYTTGHSAKSLPEPAAGDGKDKGLSLGEVVAFPVRFHVSRIGISFYFRAPFVRYWYLFCIGGGVLRCFQMERINFGVESIRLKPRVHLQFVV